MKLLNKNKFSEASVASVANKGVTLPEMLVAVAITVGMLAVIGAVFKSASDAAGKANANNDIMQQLRAVTRQIDQDFTGLRPDMPLAILWEAHQYNGGADLLGDPADNNRYVRYDRIVFFANGDFQADDGWGTSTYLSANLARIFYGQSLWGHTTPGWPIYDFPKMTPETEDTAVPRQILTRRSKLLTADTATGWNAWMGGGPFVPITGDGFSWSVLTPSPPSPAPVPAYNSTIYDHVPIENETLAFWQNEPFVNFYNYYFFTDPTNLNASASFVRRPSINAVQNNYGYDGVQRLYLLPDVTDFKIELWFPGATEWFPNEQDVAAIALAGTVWPIPFYGYGTGNNTFGFFWNTEDVPGLYDVADLPSCFYTLPDGIEWRGPNAMIAIDSNMTSPPLTWNPTDFWPEAIKFTFTLYDKHRRHFPKGQTFSYIVNLPPRP